MNILYIGDVMGQPGRKALAKVLPGLRISREIDVVVAQAENVSHGKGMSLKHYRELEESGVDGFSGGNHSFERPDTVKLVQDTNSTVVAPANVKGPLENNYKIIKNGVKKVAIVSLLGYTFPRGYNEDTINPLMCIDALLPKIQKNMPDAIIVNIHSDLSSEKVMMGHYLDGKVTATVGDHWHIPTADTRLLPKHTAHVTDVGMCGVLNSSLGVDVDVALRRWKGEQVKNVMAKEKELQFNAVLIGTAPGSLMADSIERIQYYL